MQKIERIWNKYTNLLKNADRETIGERDRNHGYQKKHGEELQEEK